MAMIVNSAWLVNIKGTSYNSRFLFGGYAKEALQLQPGFLSTCFDEFCFCVDFDIGQLKKLLVAASFFVAGCLRQAVSFLKCAPTEENYQAFFKSLG